MAQATASTARAAELVVYGKTLLATRTLQAVGRGGWRGIPRVNVVGFKRDAAPTLPPPLSRNSASCCPNYSSSSSSSSRARGKCNFVVVAPAISLYRRRRRVVMALWLRLPDNLIRAVRFCLVSCLPSFLSLLLSLSLSVNLNLSVLLRDFVLPLGCLCLCACWAWLSNKASSDNAHFRSLAHALALSLN